DLGINPTPWGYTVYGEVIAKLVQHGIPQQEIATMGDADTDVKKHVLFEKVRQGTVRILLGSTQKMGTGTNVQKRLVALHHLDAPWKPAEVEQRDGRIVRQGNTKCGVAYLGLADNSRGPLLSRVRGLSPPVVRSRNRLPAPYAALLSCFRS